MTACITTTGLDDLSASEDSVTACITTTGLNDLSASEDRA